MRYRMQRRGGKGVKDMHVTANERPGGRHRRVRDGDDIMLITMQGMVTRTHGGRDPHRRPQHAGRAVMNLNEGDKLVSVAKVASETVGE